MAFLSGEMSEQPGFEHLPTIVLVLCQLAEFFQTSESNHLLEAVAQGVGLRYAATCIFSASLGYRAVEDYVQSLVEAVGECTAAQRWVPRSRGSRVRLQLLQQFCIQLSHVSVGV